MSEPKNKFFTIRKQTNVW